MKDSNRVSSQCESLHNRFVVNVQDPTAGGAVDAEGLWKVDDKCVRQISKRIFLNDLVLGISPFVDQYEEQFESWDTSLQISEFTNDSPNSMIFDYCSFEEGERLSNHYTVEVDTMLQVITDLTKKALARKAIGEKELKKYSSPSSNGKCDVLKVIPEMIPQEGYSQMLRRERNVRFLSASGPSFVPDKLAVSWRRAAFGLIFDDDLVSSIRHKLMDFAQKLDNIVSLAITNMENEEESESRQTDYYSTQNNRAFWNNLSEWNRFQHTADLLNPTVCKAFKILSKDVISVSKSSVLASFSSPFEVLYTAAYLALCLMDNGMNKAAEMLARSCIMETFNPSTTHDEKDRDPDKEQGWQSGQDLFSTVVQCHDKIAESFWGGSCTTGLIYVMNVLFNVLETSSWSWSIKYTWNVAPCMSFATGLLSKGVDSTVNVVAPTAMILGLLCVVLPIDIGSILSVEQAAIAREKNRILSIMFQRMSETNHDFLQQISLLAPLLEQNVVHLHAPSTALMLLHSAILLNSEVEVSSNEQQRRLLFAIVAALRQQTVVLANLLTGTSSVDFSCYETQCAASTLMALETYIHSERDCNLVFGCITDPILRLLQEENSTKAIYDKNTTTRKSNKQFQTNPKIALNESLLNFYFTDGIRIASVLCGSNFPHFELSRTYGISRIDERLLVLNSPIVELMQNSDFTSRQQKSKSVLPFVVIRVLKKEEQGESTLKWQTAADLLLFFLRVDLFSKEEKTIRNSLLTLLQTACQRVGAISVMEKLHLAKDWNNIITAEELFTLFLSQKEFQKSFISQKEGYASAIAPFKDILISSAAVLPVHCSVELYKTACDLEIVEDVVVAVMANAANLQQKLSHEFVFLLAQHDTKKVTLTQRMQVGIAALQNWQQHFSTSETSLNLSNVYMKRCLFSNLDDSMILGFLRLASLSVRVDEEALVSHDTRLLATACNKMKAVNEFLSVLSQDWIDPVIAAIVLVEMCRTLQNSIEEKVHVPEDFSILSNLQQVFCAHNKFMSSSNAAKVLCKLSTASHVAKELAQKSKTSIATFLVYCKQLATKSRKKAKSKRTLDQEPHICDLICLQFLCQVCPDDGFEFETLINLENESQSRRRNYQHPDPGYKYQKVVKQFKQLKNPETADSSTTTNATSNSEAVNVNSWQLLAFQNVPPKSQRYSESYGSDDSD
ncbi:uncharacterized protein LOC134194121 isoform X2 [Corticium candelabrum]|uniref:uncharacterized protein LOC134194121 isoform X2 n=1 Tax=Corticium candelabrum TaxID=121492 RepID=UPI002E25DCC3|nr:uncharacterized protein LOC134194121 isoform X2 [Corticium candelabrum]